MVKSGWGWPVRSWHRHSPLPSRGTGAFEERRWIIGNGLRSLESPSGHLPARPAQRHLPHTLPKAEPPVLLITPQTMLRPWDPVCPMHSAREELARIAHTGKQSRPRYMGLGTVCWDIPSLLTPGTRGDTLKAPELGDRRPLC